MTSRSSVSILVFLALAGPLALGGCSSTPRPQAADSTAATRDDLVGPSWHWVATQTPVDLVTPGDPSLYTIQFNADGSANLRADCNRGRGSYATTPDGGLVLGPAALTRALCPPGSLDGKFLTQLNNTAHWFFRGDTLYIDLKMDSGTMRFARGPGESP